MLDAVAPDVVHVCTPHHRHAEMAAECLARDVSVLLEKPVAHTLADGERLVRWPRRTAGRCSASASRTATTTPPRTLRELLDRGGLGRVLGARASVTLVPRRRLLRAPGLARPLGHRRRRGADEPGDPHPRPAAVVRRPGDRRPRHRRHAGAARSHRGGGHRRAAAAAPHRGRRHRHARSSTPPTATSRTPRSPSRSLTEHARVRLDTDLTVTHHDGRVEIFHPATAASGTKAYWGALARAADRRLLPARPRGQALLDRRARRPGDLRVIQAVYDQCPGRADDAGSSSPTTTWRSPRPSRPPGAEHCANAAVRRWPNAAEPALDQHALAPRVGRAPPRLELLIAWRASTAYRSSSSLEHPRPGIPACTCGRDLPRAPVPLTRYPGGLGLQAGLPRCTAERDPDHSVTRLRVVLRAERSP